MLDGFRFEPRVPRLLWGALGGAALGAPLAFVLPGAPARATLVVLAALAGAAFAACVWGVGLRRSGVYGAAWGAALGLVAAFEDLRLLPLVAVWGALLGAGLAKALGIFEDAVERRLVRAAVVTVRRRIRWPFTPRARRG